MDLSTLTWLPDGTAADLPTPRAGAGTAALGDRVILTGGEGFGAAWPTVSALDVATGVWAALPPLVEARHGTGLVSCGGVLTTAAGAGAQAGGVYRTTTETYHAAAAPGAPPPPPCGATAVDVPGAAPPPPAGVAPLPTAVPHPTAAPPTAAPSTPPPVPGAPPLPPTATVAPGGAPPTAGGGPPPAGGAAPEVAPTPAAGDGPSATPDEDAAPTEAPACFPAAATVATRGGRVVRMADLRRGDPIRVVSAATGTAGWSRVVLFSHATGGSGDGGPAHPYVELTVAAGGGGGDRRGGGRECSASARAGASTCGIAPPARLRLSAGHLLPVGANQQLRPARSVAVGDTVWVLAGAAANGSTPSSPAAGGATSAGSPTGPAAVAAATVAAVARVPAAGLYSPHTAATDDRLVVDGVVVADTTDALPHVLAAAGLAVARAVASVGGGDVTGGGLAGEGGWGGVARRALVALASVRGG